MINDVFQERVIDVDPSIATTAFLGLLMFFGILTLHSKTFEAVLPGVPKLKGYPLVGAIPIYFRDGMSLMLERLTKIGEDGISYAQVGNKTLVSVHDPTMVKEVLTFPDGIASRYVASSQDSLAQHVLNILDWEILAFSAGHRSGPSYD